MNCSNATNDPKYSNAKNESSHQSSNDQSSVSEKTTTSPSSPASKSSHPDASALSSNQIVDSMPPHSDEKSSLGKGSSSETQNIIETNEPNKDSSATNKNAMAQTQDTKAMVGKDICQKTNNSASIPSDSSDTFPAASSVVKMNKRNNVDADEEDAKQAAKRKKKGPIQFKSVPPSKEGIKLYSRNDVLCGRGGGTNVHPGNRKFRDLINANRRAYLKARKNDKPAISRSIVRTIRENNGRFLKKEEKLGLWFEIGDDGAREKTSQALRQRAPEMRKILFEDEQRQVQEQLCNSMMMGNGMGMDQMGMMMGLNPNKNLNQMLMMQNVISMNNCLMNQMNLGMPASMLLSQDAQDLKSSRGSKSLDESSRSPGSKVPHSSEELALLAKYNALTQNKFLQEKNILLQRLAMAGIDPTQFQQQTASIEQMQTKALMGQEMKPVTPRGA